MENDFPEPNPPSNDQAFRIYLGTERDFMAANGYAESEKATLRGRALELTVKYSKCEGFDPYIPYMALSYFDRFISRNSPPIILGQVDDDLDLLIVTCLVVAWKFRDLKFRFSKFGVQNDLYLKYKDCLVSAESSLLRGLNWRLRSVTPFTFVPFLAKMFTAAKGLDLHSVYDMITQSQGDIKFTKYPPSVISASALLTTCKIGCPDQYHSCKQKLLAVGYFNEEELEGCSKRIYHMWTNHVEGIQKKLNAPLVDARNASPVEAVNNEETSYIAHKPRKEHMQETSYRSGDDTALMNIELNWLLRQDVKRN